MIAAPVTPPRKPRGRAPTTIIVTVSFQRVPVADFARGWAPVVARAAARLAARGAEA